MISDSEKISGGKYYSFLTPYFKLDFLLWRRLYGESKCSPMELEFHLKIFIVVAPSKL